MEKKKDRNGWEGRNPFGIGQGSLSIWDRPVVQLAQHPINELAARGGCAIAG